MTKIRYIILLGLIPSTTKKGFSWNMGSKEEKEKVEVDWVLQEQQFICT